MLLKLRCVRRPASQVSTISMSPRMACSHTIGVGLGEPEEADSVEVAQQVHGRNLEQRRLAARRRRLRGLAEEALNSSTPSGSSPTRLSSPPRSCDTSRSDHAESPDRTRTLCCSRKSPVIDSVDARGHRGSRVGPVRCNGQCCARPELQSKGPAARTRRTRLRIRNSPRPGGARQQRALPGASRKDSSTPTPVVIPIARSDGCDEKASEPNTKAVVRHESSRLRSVVR